jgi:hypothetical protein
MPKRSRLLCQCRRAELILDRMIIEIHKVPFDSLFDLNMSLPLLCEMWHGPWAWHLGRIVSLNGCKRFVAIQVRVGHVLMCNQTAYTDCCLPEVEYEGLL